MRRYRNRFKGRLPKESRTISLHQEGTDNGQLYRCWNCGFVCNDHRETLGDESSRSGVTHSDYSYEAPGAEPGVPESAFAIMGGILGVMVAVSADSSGSAKTVKHQHLVSGQGCPLCHTLNWRGDY